jgi:hypothetical protein
MQSPPKKVCSRKRSKYLLGRRNTAHGENERPPPKKYHKLPKKQGIKLKVVIDQMATKNKMVASKMRNNKKMVTRKIRSNKKMMIRMKKARMSLT